MSRLSSRGRYALLFAVVAVGWGGSYVGIKFGLTHGLPPVLYAALRFDVGAALLLPGMWVATDRDRLPRSRDDFRYLLLGAAFIVGLTNAFLFLGQQSTTSAVGSVMFSLNPVLAAGFAWLLLPSERPSLREAVGVLLGLVGVVVVAGPSVAAFGSGARGIAYLFVAAASLALGSVLTRRLSPSISATAGTAWSMLLGAVALHAASALVEPWPTGVSASTGLVVAVAYLGVVSTAAAYGAYFALLDGIGAVRTNLVSYVVPIVAALAAWLLQGTPVSATTAAGFLVVFVGFVLVNWGAVRERLGGLSNA